MADDKKKSLIIGTILLIVTIIGFYLILTPTGVGILQKWTNSLKEVDETSYENQKKVEDTARSMISSYKSDKLTYDTYINSEDEEEQSWAKQAKIRANTTANSYNEYILKNSHIWKDNIPDDIDKELPLIE